MGIFDKAKDALGDHPEQVDQGLDKVADAVDDRTGNKYSEQIDKGADQAGDYLDGQDAAAQPPA